MFGKRLQLQEGVQVLIAWGDRAMALVINVRFQSVNKGLARTLCSKDGRLI